MAAKSPRLANLGEITARGENNLQEPMKGDRETRWEREKTTIAGIGEIGKTDF